MSATWSRPSSPPWRSSPPSPPSRPARATAGRWPTIGRQSAEAFEGGFDGDHAWVKVSAGDIAGGVAQTACRTYAGPAAFLCPWFAQRASEIVGSSSGVWAELYTNGHVNIGTW